LDKNQIFTVLDLIFNLGGEINLKLIFGFKLEVKILTLSFVVPLHSHSICVIENIGEMAEEISSENDSFVVKNIQNVHHMKTDVVKFNDTNNFELWRCVVMDTLNAQNLKDTIELQERPAEVDEKVCKKMNRMAYGVIRS